MSSGIIPLLAWLIGTTEPAVRLLLSLFVGYPVAAVHRSFLRNHSATLQHAFFVTVGVWLGYFNYGYKVGHSVLCVLVQWLLLRVLGGTVRAVVTSFVFQMTYLIIGYVISQTDGYDINWSTPHCVLTLRLIGVAFDAYDGHKDKAYLRPDQTDSALAVIPSLLEMSGHALFPASSIVGPQFPLQRYLHFTHGTLKFAADETGLPDCRRPAFIRGGLGVCYLVLHQLLTSLLVPDEYFYGDQFLDSGLFNKMFWVGVWVKVIFMRYLAAWLFAEGGCIMIGLTYNGDDGEGRPRWDGLANVDIGKYENAVQFEIYPSAFNVNTNNWVAKYIFKRLRFLGSKELSQLLTLFFLAVWHGYHLGYFIVFGMEFLIIMWERKVVGALRQYPGFVRMAWGPSEMPHWPTQLVLRLYTMVFLGYSCVPFVCVVRRRWWPVLASVYCCGHLVFATWPLVLPAIHWLLPRLGFKRAAKAAATPVRAESDGSTKATAAVLPAQRDNGAQPTAELNNAESEHEKLS